jgi:hypothetical protein
LKGKMFHVKRFLRNLFGHRENRWRGIDPAGVVAYDLSESAKQLVSILPPTPSVRPGYDLEEISWPVRYKIYNYSGPCTPEHRCGRCGRSYLT